MAVPEIKNGVTNYRIKEKYCPSLGRNVPVMVFSDENRTEVCWQTESCESKTEKCFMQKN